jgi:hypothetical protein
LEEPRARIEELARGFLEQGVVIDVFYVASAEEAPLGKVERESLLGSRILGQREPSFLSWDGVQTLMRADLAYY